MIADIEEGTILFAERRGCPLLSLRSQPFPDRTLHMIGAVLCILMNISDTKLRSS